MPPPHVAKPLANGAALLWAMLALGACASGGGMSMAGNDGGPAGFEEEPQDATVDDSLPAEASKVDGASILAASGNSLLPLPAGFRSGALTPAAGGPDLAAAAVGLPGAAPLVGATVGAVNGGLPDVSLAVAGRPLASVSGGGVTVLGASPAAVVGGTVATTTSLVSATTSTVASTAAATTNTLVSNVSGAVMAVTGAAPSPMTAMTPGATPLSTLLTTLTRPAGL